jgi:signal transduction histidine kinase
MSEPIWGERTRPAPDPDADIVAVWELMNLAQLSACRRELWAALHDGARPPAVAEEPVERLLLAFGELASNALRHARPPVHVVIADIGRAWLLDVSDAEPGTPPVPATDRDPARGGLGLPMVARICAEHGWTVHGGRKHVWAQVEYAAAEESAPTGPGPGFLGG